jgi:hypothetical protein
MVYLSCILLQKKRGDEIKGVVLMRYENVIEFIHSWSDDIFWRHFGLCCEDFKQLYTASMQHLVMKKGYDAVKHSKMANKSSGSPISLELQLYITLRLLSGASYLDMVWYAVSLSCVHELFWKTICIIDSAINNIQLPQDSTGVALIVDG